MVTALFFKLNFISLCILPVFIYNIPDALEYSNSGIISLVHGESLDTNKKGSPNTYDVTHFEMKNKPEKKIL